MLGITSLFSAAISICCLKTACSTGHLRSDPPSLAASASAAPEPLAFVTVTLVGERKAGTALLLEPTIGALAPNSMPFE